MSIGNELVEALGREFKEDAVIEPDLNEMGDSGFVDITFDRKNPELHIILEVRKGKDEIGFTIDDGNIGFGENPREIIPVISEVVSRIRQELQ